MQDETLSHVPLFKNIFRNAVSELYDGVIPLEVEKEIKRQVILMADAEKRWAKYALKGILGASEKAIDILVETQANSVCSNLGIGIIYEKHSYSPLNKLLSANLKGDGLSSRTNFFTGNVSEYSKSSVIIDF